MKWYAIIVAAGSSRRAGFDKLSAPLAGRAVLLRSVDAFVAAQADGIILVTPLTRWQELDCDALARELPMPLLRVDGGKERQDSVYAGLAALPADCDYVAVHDGARPLISPTDILSCLAAAQETGAATCAHPIVDTLKRADAAQQSLPEPISRDNLWGMETPQTFQKDLLLQAYQQLLASGVTATDEVSALEQVGKATQLVSSQMNMKITLPHDLALAELFWQQRQVK